MPLTILITGDRNWTSREAIEFAFDKEIEPLLRQGMVTLKAVTIIEGGARGADKLCYMVAKKRGYQVLSFPADWKQFGRAAGPIRNRQMITDGQPDYVIAFHDDLSQSKGTRDMVKFALKRGLQVTLYNSRGGAQLLDPLDYK